MRPRRRRRAARVFYFHGGGHVHPLTADYWRLVRALMTSPAEVVVPAYPLAPGSTVDDVLPRLVDLVTEIHGGDPDLPTILMGDSAGAALALVVAGQLREDVPPVPAAVVALCPWLDAPSKNARSTNSRRRPDARRDRPARCGRWWVGDRDPRDGLVSPLHGDLAGLPPVEVFVGGRDSCAPRWTRWHEAPTGRGLSCG